VNNFLFGLACGVLLILAGNYLLGKIESHARRKRISALFNIHDLDARIPQPFEHVEFLKERDVK
jgi:hypothetical protein